MIQEQITVRKQTTGNNYVVSLHNVSLTGGKSAETTSFSSCVSWLFVHHSQPCSRAFLFCLGFFLNKLPKNCISASNSKPPGGRNLKQPAQIMSQFTHHDTWDNIADLSSPSTSLSPSKHILHCCLVTTCILTMKTNQVLGIVGVVSCFPVEWTIVMMHILIS